MPGLRLEATSRSRISEGLQRGRGGRHIPECPFREAPAQAARASEGGRSEHIGAGGGSPGEPLTPNTSFQCKETRGLQVTSPVSPSNLRAGSGQKARFVLTSEPFSLDSWTHGVPSGPGSDQHRALPGEKNPRGFLC